MTFRSRFNRIVIKSERDDGNDSVVSFISLRLRARDLLSGRDTFVNVTWYSVDSNCLI